MKGQDDTLRCSSTSQATSCWYERPSGCGSASSSDGFYLLNERLPIRILGFLSRRSLPIVVSVVLLLGAAYSVWLGSKTTYPDERGYIEIACNIARNSTFSFNGVDPSAFRTPGNPLILAGFFRLGLPLGFARWSNFVFLVISVGIMVSILSAIGRNFSSSIAPFLLLCYPVLLYTAGTFYPQTLAGTLLLLSVFLVVKPSKPRLFLSGVTFGVLALVVPAFVLNVPVFLASPLFLKTRKKMISTALILLGFCLPLTPWTLRNYAEFHSFIPLSTNGGLNLLLGNSENARLNSGVNVDISKYVAVGSRLNEHERDVYYTKQALNWVLKNKLKAVKLYFLKVLNYFNFENELYVKKEGSAARDMIMLFTYGPLLLLFLARTITGRWLKLTRMELFMIVFYLSNSLLSAIFFTRIRFRVPYDLLLITVATTTIEALVVHGRSIGGTRPSLNSR